ncbi:MAG: hypothetical protein H6Q39_158, partial [Chloroflexi bacterium]|nr:hypothetical protein [Chloroflexota bacterium]
PNYSQAGTYANVRFSVSDGTATDYENITITVAHPYEDWDTNQDGSINVLDVIITGQQVGKSGPAGWIKEDVNHDGLISLLDTDIIGQHLVK